jgi:hypothetical protein
MKISKRLLVVGFGLLLCVGACKKGVVDEAKYDSLFLGISLGMKKNDFFDYCWKMNKEKKFVHGPTNTSVLYRLGGALPDTIQMQFYPTFYEDKIYEMPVLFSYESWAPWNKQYSSDTLMIKLKPVLEKWYGGEFQKLEHKTMGTVYYRMDGKRRLNYFKRDDQFVQLVFTDLKVEKMLTEKADTIKGN